MGNVENYKELALHSFCDYTQTSSVDERIKNKNIRHYALFLRCAYKLTHQQV